jgi:hypothetical protein
MPLIPDYAADADPLKLQHLQNRVLHAIDRRTPVRDLHFASKMICEYVYIPRLCRKCAEFIQNHLNPNVRENWPSEGMHRKHNGLTFGDDEAYDRSVE